MNLLFCYRSRKNFRVKRILVGKMDDFLKVIYDIMWVRSKHEKEPCDDWKVSKHLFKSLNCTVQAVTWETEWAGMKGPLAGHHKWYHSKIQTNVESYVGSPKMGDDPGVQRRRGSDLQHLGCGI